VIQAASQVLSCPLGSLPCAYLGLLLSLSKPRKAELQIVLDKLAAKLPSWKAKLMSREGRRVYVRAVMTAAVIYQLVALDLDPWFFKVVDKLRRSFFWAGAADAQSGCCSVAWRLVCQPKDLGGLGLLDVRRANIALRARWAWLRKTDGSRPWSSLKLHLGCNSLALFNACRGKWFFYSILGRRLD
jgi:hypothetical protein